MIPLFYNWFSPETPIFVIPFLVYVIAVFTLSGQWLEIYLFRRKSVLAMAMIIVLSLTAAGLFFLPYMAWARGTVPDRGTATIFAVMLGLVTIFSAGQYMRVRFPLGKKKRHDEDWDDTEAVADTDEIEF
ncbi:MAG TPA: hypothetical protein VHO69_07020 [Phototrophicaceae bacterium]|nr:hypothetical protein [Phototrophicaceae bacterium]